MSTSTTEIANSVMICKKGHVRCPMATSKPFVVCSAATKRYAPSTKGVSRDGSLLAVVPNAGPRRPQPSRFAPSQPFVVCSLSTKRHAPSKRVSTNKVSQDGSSSPSPPMSTSTTEITNSVMICKKGHVRCPMATSKPFVVCSVATKRYAPSTKGVSRDDSLPAVVPNAGPRRPQPSRFAPSKPFLVCSLFTKRYAPSKRASTNTPITYHDAMSPSSSPDLSSFLSQSCRVVPSLNRCSYRRSNVPSRHPHPIDFPSATFSPSTFAIVNAFTPSRARFATTSDISPKKPRNTSIVTLLRQPCPPLQSLHYHSDLVEQPAPRTSATPSLLPPIFMTITITSPDSLHMPSLQHAHLGRGDRLRAVVATRCSLCGLL
ncbi:hypothetical protein EV363DRAFT_437339 [Boletus edulis]|nr:hypothetical protein EV363DRAFT_437339 [Boletus edulis]